MIKLAAKFQPPTHSSAFSNSSDPHFPSIPKVVTLQDISPHHEKLNPPSRSSAELSLPPGSLESHDYHVSYFSPSPPRPHKRSTNPTQDLENSVKRGLYPREEMGGDSLGKRLNFDERSLMTFRGEEEKMSYELSKSIEDQQSSQ